MASFKDLPPGNVRTAEGWAAYQRGSLSDEDREKYDDLVDDVSSFIERESTPNNSVRGGATYQKFNTTSSALTLRVYTQAMRRDDGEKVQLQALVEGGPAVETRPRSDRVEGVSVR